MIIIGRTLPAPATVETLAIAVTGRLPQSEAAGSHWWYSSAPRQIRLAGRRSHAVQGEVHDDPVAEAIRWSICEGELIQAIARVSGQPVPPAVAKANPGPEAPPPPMFNGAATQPPPQYTGLKLQGISGPAGKKLAILNSQTFSKGEGGRVKISGKEVAVRCLEIREKSVLLAIDGSNQEVFGNW
jgi:hypothetical protein